MWDITEDQITTSTRLGGPSGSSSVFSLSSVDTFSPLTENKNGNCVIKVVVDNFSKLIGRYPARNTTSKDYFGAIIQGISNFLGYIRGLNVNDGGSQFTSKLAQD